MKKIAVLTAALLASSAAFAGTGFYATADYTALELSTDNGGSADFGSIGLAAGYQFNEYIAAEARVATGANDEDLGNGISFGLNSYIGAQAVLTVPLTQSFAAYATLGYGSGELQASQGNVQVTDSDTSMSYGAGVQYSFGNLGVRAGYENLYDKDGLEIDGFKITGVYRF